MDGLFSFATTLKLCGVGVPELESGTSSLSATRSNQLSYTPESTLVCLSRAMILTSNRLMKRWPSLQFWKKNHLPFVLLSHSASVATSGKCTNPVAGVKPGLPDKVLFSAAGHFCLNRPQSFC